MAAKRDTLTAKECDNATSKGKSIRKLHDGAGLYLWVYEDGRKYWRLRYWTGGKEKSLSLGVYPEIGLKEARVRRNDNRTLMGESIDPSADRKARKLRQRLAAENSFESVAREWYAKQLHTWVPKHADDVLRRFEINAFPFIGARPIAEIEAPELLEMSRKIEKRGAHDLAHRLMQACGQVFRYGIATGVCKRDVAADLRGALTPHVKKHQAAVRPEEVPALLRAIDTYAATQSSWTRWQASRGTDVERRTTLLERLWREGELSTSDYLQQLKQTLDTQLAGAELEARLWRSYADYLAATGQLERWAGLEGTP